MSDYYLMPDKRSIGHRAHHFHHRPGAVRIYIESLLPPEVGDMIRSGTLNLRSLYDGLAEIAKLTGYGKYEFPDMRYEQDENDFYAVTVTNPFSVYICAATHGAALEAMPGYDREVGYYRVGPGAYQVTARPFPRPEELRRRLAPRPYEHREGNLDEHNMNIRG